MRGIFLKNLKFQESPEILWKLEVFILLSCVFCFMGCLADSSLKKRSLPGKQTVNQFVESHYNPSVDILFIIDDSKSMRDIQDLLAKNAELFIDQFLDTRVVDYHIAVTSSSIVKTDKNRIRSYDVGGGSWSPPPKVYGGLLTRCDKLAEEQGYDYPNYVERKFPRAGECLKEMMEVGTTGNGSGHFLNIPLLVLSGTMLAKNSSFYRPEAHLAVFVITDTRDDSKLVSEVSYQFLLDLKEGNWNKLHFALGIVDFQIPQYSCERDDPDPSFKLMEMVKLFGPRGFQFELCQFGYGKDLARFANHLVDSVLTVPLEDLPDVDTIEVYYVHEDGSQWIPNSPRGWVYDVKKNAIHLSRNIHLEQTEGQFSIKYKPIYR